jgi:regulation of enolase protein 1 (concanavalin A-like superfamily)
MNLLRDLSSGALASRLLTWDHPPLRWEPLPGSGMRVHVPARVDYFQSPAGTHAADNAPFLWANAVGDFVAQAQVQPGFATHYDAGALMVRSSARQWAKLCYEATDFGTHAVVSVVTREYSDDANGVNLTVPAVWLQLFRKGDVFGMHYALDGEGWQMVRLFRLEVSAAVKVGLVAQCPAGPGTTIDFLSFSVEPRSVKDLRAGK